ncbi:MAG: alanine racemase, partial [Ilumatobacteraceae bacterium]
LAVADDITDTATAAQLDAFEVALATLPDGPAIHAANSAAALAHPRARYSFVRAGIAMYGISPGHGVDHLCGDLRPSMSLRARVSFVKRVERGTRISYGLRHTFADATTVATVPIGYADGVPRRLFETGGEVLVGGRRRPIVGVVTMDQLMVDVGDDAVAVGDEVVLIGEQQGERVSAEEWADRLGTIGYEVVCGVSRRIARTPRRSISA